MIASRPRRCMCLNCKEMREFRSDSFYKWASFWTGLIAVLFIVVTILSQIDIWVGR